MNNSLNTFISHFPKSTCLFLHDTVQNWYRFDCWSLFVLNIISRTFSYILKKNFKNTLLKYFIMCACVLDPQSRPTLCNPRDCGPQAALAVKFSRQEYWSALPCSTPGDLPDPGIEPESPASPASQVYSLPAEPSGKPISSHGFNEI